MKTSYSLSYSLSPLYNLDALHDLKISQPGRHQELSQGDGLVTATKGLIFFSYGYPIFFHRILIPLF